MKNLIFIFSLFIWTSVFGQDTIQVDNISDFNDLEYVFLFSNQVIKGNSVLFEKEQNGKYSIKVETLIFEPKTVKFFQNNQGFYANVSTTAVSNVFAKRIKTGNINLYEYGFEGQTYYVDHRTGEGRKRTYKVKEQYFYNTGFENIKKVTYNNLKLELGADQEVMNALNRYKKKQKIGNLNIALGSLMVTTSLISSINKAKKSFGVAGENNNYIIEGALLFAGGGLISIGYKKNLNKKEELIEAIDIFNR